MSVPRAFPGAVCGADVVPGRPARVAQIAEQLQLMSDGLLRLAMLLRNLDALDWHGVARLAMVGLVASQVEPVARAGALMAQSAEHLRQHARVLSTAQTRADDAVQLDVHVPSAPGVTAAAALRAVAEQEVMSARAMVRASATSAADGLQRAAALGPHRPGVLGRGAARAHGWQRDLATGSMESQMQLVTLALRFSGPRLFADPAGYADDVEATTRSALALVVHPRRLAATALDLDTWRASTGRWLGHQGVGAALGLAGAGGLAVGAGRAATLPARALALAPTERGAALRTAIRARPTAGRSPLRAHEVRPWASEPSPFGTVSRLPAVPQAVVLAASRDAAWAERLTTPRVQAVADRVGAVRVGHASVLKGVPSLSRKLGDELADPRTAAAARSPVQVAGRINDTVRYTLVLPDRGYAAGAVRTVQALRVEGFDLAAAKCTWGGARYQGVNLTLNDPATGRLLEVQVHTPASWEATVRTHHDYELYRDAGIDPMLKAPLERAIGAEYARVPRPAGVSGLGEALRGLGTDVPAVSRPGSLPVHDPWALVRQGLPTAVAGSLPGSVASRPDAPVSVRR